MITKTDQEAFEEWAKIEAEYSEDFPYASARDAFDIGVAHGESRMRERRDKELNFRDKVEGAYKAELQAVKEDLKWALMFVETNYESEKVNKLKAKYGWQDDK